MVKPEADRKEIVLRPRFEPDEIVVDSGRLNRVLVNLISNAVKFSPENSSVDITCEKSTGKHSIPMLEFKIIDHGPGIPESKIDLVFEKFKQAGRGDEGEKKGSGLGLAICKAIVEAHGGEIGVESELEEGSIFWFRIPQYAESNEDAA